MAEYSPLGTAEDILFEGLGDSQALSPESTEGDAVGLVLRGLKVGRLCWQVFEADGWGREPGRTGAGRGFFDVLRHRPQPRNRVRMAAGDAPGPAGRRTARRWRGTDQTGGAIREVGAGRASVPGRRGNGFLPGPGLGEVQGETTGLAGDASGQGEEAAPEGLGGRQRLAQARGARSSGPGCGARTWTASQAALAAKASPRAGGLRPTPYFRSADGILHLGVAAMVGLECQGVRPSRSVMKA